jgi:hypothetical protein
MVSIPFSSSHCSTLCCFFPWSVCNLVLANNSKTNGNKKEREKRKRKKRKKK